MLNNCEKPCFGATHEDVGCGRGLCDCFDRTPPWLRGW